MVAPSKTPSGATLTLTLHGSPEALELAQRVLMVISKLGDYGASRNVIVPIDGDGPIRLHIDGITLPPLRREDVERATDQYHALRLGDFLPPEGFRR